MKERINTYKSANFELIGQLTQWLTDMQFYPDQIISIVHRVEEGWTVVYWVHTIK